MASLQSIAPPANGPGAIGAAIQNGSGQNLTGVAPADESSQSQALVPLSRDAPDGEPSSIPARVAGLPVELDVSIPVRNFRVRNLLALEASHLIESEWGHGDDVPLAAGQVQLAWTEFEVVDTQLAVRVTRLA